MRINRFFLHYCRTLHVYLTMLGLIVMLLFGITGFTVNHEDWFGATKPRLTESESQTPIQLIQKADALHIVEHLRTTLHIKAAMTGYDDLDDRLAIGFKSPGESWEVEIEKSTGKTTVRAEAYNFAAVINNLHRGRYTGQFWSWVIDISATLIVLACVTGFVLWLALPKRRQLGIASLLIGTVGVLFIIYMLVPGQDTKPQPRAESPATLQSSQ